MVFTYIKNQFFLNLGLKVDVYLFKKTYNQLKRACFEFMGSWSLAEMKEYFQDAIKYRYWVVDARINQIIQSSLLALYLIAIYYLFPKLAL